MRAKKSHWENVFATKSENETSWFQPYPKTSIDFLNLFDLKPDAFIIDVGGGDSYFIDTLIKDGYQNINLLDISANAIQRVKTRLGSNAGKTNYIVSDVLDFKPTVKFDFWHDRAAFHFLTTEEHISNYISIVEKAIKPGGYMVLGTFSEKGPTKCSGLEIKQYNEVAMSILFEKYFEKIKCMEEDHLTPFNTTQNFMFCSFRRK